jgi:hypothetical protein
MEDRSLKKRRTKVDVVGRTPKGRTSEKKRRTHPECNNGIRDRGAKQSILRRNGRRMYEALQHKFEPEAVKIVVESYIGLREPGDGTLWKCRPPPKWKR